MAVAAVVGARHFLAVLALVLADPVLVAELKPTCCACSATLRDEYAALLEQLPQQQWQWQHWPS
jgi:hypothetical protein